MKRTIRLALFLLVGLTLSVACLHAFSSWVRAERWDPRGLAETLVRENRRHQRLDAESTAVLESVKRKMEITDELLAGRLTLDEAAQHFRECEAQRAERLGDNSYPVESFPVEDVLSRVLRWTRASALERGPRTKAAARALEKEYRLRTRRGGSVLLAGG